MLNSYIQKNQCTNKLQQTKKRVYIEITYYILRGLIFVVSRPKTQQEAKRLENSQLLRKT